MNRFHLSVAGLILVAGLQSLSVQAQEAPVNVKKELSKVIAELPAEEQLKVLEYAQRKREAIRVAAEKTAPAPAAAVAAAPAPAPQQAQVKPAPAPAQPATVQPAQPVAAKSAQPAIAQPAAPAQQALQLSQPANPTVAAATPAPAPEQPAKPAYLTEAETLPATTVQWYDTDHNFNNIIEGTTATHAFKFKNTGTQPLKLTRVKASCGCTTPNWSKEAIMPGEEGFVEIAFNSAGKLGPQTKTVTVTGNFPNYNMVLKFRGEVIKAETPAATPGDQAAQPRQ
ncbi:MAG: DUF1573 domain-containing protein [Bacteroidia bacterium]|nr:DUF1573 domain-containing protein [Bacteroidia bacterium]